MFFKQFSRFGTLAGTFILLASLGLACASGGGPGRGPGRPGGMRGGMPRPDPREIRKKAEENFVKMCRELELSETQQKEARKLFEETMESREKLTRELRDRKIEYPAARDQMEKAFQDYRGKLTVLLDEEQKKKLEIFWERWLSSGM